MLDARCQAVIIWVWGLMGATFFSGLTTLATQSEAVNVAIRDKTAAPGGEAPAAATVPPAVVAFLSKAPAYDEDWPPEYTSWVFESSGALSSDSWRFNVFGLSDQLAVRVAPKTWKAYFYGMPQTGPDPKMVWNGKGISWRLRDSRDLLANAIFRMPVVRIENLKTAPRACVAVYTVADGKMIASIEAPLIHAVTTVRIMKHFSYNRLNLVWSNTGLKRGFTIPDHVPLRLVLGVTAATPGTAVAVTLEIEEGGHL